jgi:predicted nucleic acid-binding protein
MKGKTFADSNIVLYAFGRDNDARKGIALELLAAKPCISTQVINEVLNVLYRKFHFSHDQALEVFTFLTSTLPVFPVANQEISTGLEIKRVTGYSYWDSLIIATAICNGCSLLYTEDLADGQKVNKRLTIVNPFS